VLLHVIKILVLQLQATAKLSMEIVFALLKTISHS
jgi:hypothetical protein